MNLRFMKTIKDYTDEFFQQYIKVAEADSENDLNEAKSKVLDIRERAKAYHILYADFPESELQILRAKSNKDVVEAREELLKLMFDFLRYKWRKELVMDKGYKEWYDFTLIYCLTVSALRKIGDGKKLAEFRAKFDKYRKEIHDEKKLPAVVFKSTLECAKTALKEYRTSVEDYFFRIREYFHWYSPEIRIYMGSYEKDKGYIAIYAYPASERKLFLYDRRILASSMPSNIEEIQKHYRLATMRFVDKDGVGEIFKSIFNRNMVFMEFFSIFWRTVPVKERNSFLQKLLSSMGVTVKEVAPSVFQVVGGITNFLGSKISIENKSLVILPNKLYMDSGDFAQSIEEVLKKCKVGARDKFYFLSPSGPAFPGNKYVDRCFNILSPLVEFIVKNKAEDLIVPAFYQTFLKTATLKEIGKEKARADEGEKLIGALKSFDIKANTFGEYEALVERIFRFVFSDSFGCYYAKTQATEYDGHRRRDLVISNETPKADFWREIKREHNARQIIVDAKKYSSEIGQETVHDVSRYLNARKGNFAIIVSMLGISKSGEKEQQLKYENEGKILLHLDAEDLHEMIACKLNKEAPENVLSRKISRIYTS